MAHKFLTGVDISGALVVAAKLTLPQNIWHGAADGKDRFMFEENSVTYIRGHAPTAALIVNNAEGAIVAHFAGDGSLADGDTALLIRRNVGGTRTVQRVSMGAANSGGTGFKVLRVPN